MNCTGIDLFRPFKEENPLIVRYRQQKKEKMVRMNGNSDR